MSIVKGAERVGIARVGDQFWILPVQVTRSSHTAEVNNSLSKDNFVIKKIYFNEKTCVRINKHPSIAFVRIPSIKWKCFLRLSLSLSFSLLSVHFSICLQLRSNAHRRKLYSASSYRCPTSSVNLSWTSRPFCWDDRREKERIRSTESQR